MDYNTLVLPLQTPAGSHTLAQTPVTTQQPLQPTCVCACMGSPASNRLRENFTQESFIQLSSALQDTLTHKCCTSHCLCCVGVSVAAQGWAQCKHGEAEHQITHVVCIESAHVSVLCSEPCQRIFPACHSAQDMHDWCTCLAHTCGLIFFHQEMHIDNTSTFPFLHNVMHMLRSSVTLMLQEWDDS